VVKLAHVFQRIQPKRILVAGDFVVDRYTFGTSKRISPEAPVPVVRVDREEDKPGGAGNVCLNLASQGMHVIAFGRVGNDSEGKSLLTHLQNQHVETKWIVRQDNFRTHYKIRVIAQSQQIVRIDFEKEDLLSSDLENALLLTIPQMLDNVDLVAISDYAKGFLTDNVLQTLIRQAKARNIPIISDPKGTNFQKYANSTILKPNLSEAYASIGNAKIPLKDVAKRIFEFCDIETLMITRSEDGISTFTKKGVQQDFPIKAKEVKDVTGAGDTVLATLASALANRLSVEEATELANVAAMISVERIGCTCVSLSDIAERLVDLHETGKVMTNEQFSALENVLPQKLRTKVLIDCSMDSVHRIIKSLRDARSMQNSEVIAVVPKAFQNDDMLQLLDSLSDVDYVVLEGN